MKTALISGSNGFIGSHLKKRLVKDGIIVFTVDHNKLRDFEALAVIINQAKPNLIFHLSAYGNLISQQDEDEIMKANVVDLYTLLQATKNVSYETFVNFSSSSTLLPYETLYSATKGAGERLCKAFATKYKKNILSILPYTVIGVGEHPEHLIPTLIRSCLNNEKMSFVGTPVHDFIGVNDFIDAIKLIGEKYHMKGSVEVGTGIKTTNEEILKLVEEVTGCKANITRVGEMRSYDTNDWKANPIIIYSLGWEQKESLKKIIEDMVKDFESKSAGRA